MELIEEISMWRKATKKKERSFIVVLSISLVQVPNITNNNKNNNNMDYNPMTVCIVC